MPYTPKSALEALITLRSYLIAVGVLSNGYMWSFDRIVRRLSKKAVEEELV